MDEPKQKEGGTKDEGSVGKIFVWGEKQQHSFEAIQTAILKNAVFTPDPEKQIHIAADPSIQGMGTVVFQLDVPINAKVPASNRQTMRVLMFISQRFTPAESRYTNSEREALAVIKALAEARYMVLDSQFPIMIYTDHQALMTLLLKEAKGRIANWQMQLSDYDLRIAHIPGK